MYFQQEEQFHIWCTLTPDVDGTRSILGVVFKDFFTTDYAIGVGVYQWLGNFTLIRFNSKHDIRILFVV